MIVSDYIYISINKGGRYCFILYTVIVYAYPLLGRLPLSSYPSNPWFLLKNTVLPWFLYAVLRVLRGRRGGGGTWVDWRRPQPHKCFYPGVQFNLPTRLPISDPNPDPVTAGDWEAELRGSSMNRTSQRWLRCDRLPTPVLVKGVLPFFCHESTKWRDND